MKIVYSPIIVKMAIRKGMIRMSLFEKTKNYRKNNPKKLFETFMSVFVIAMITMGAAIDSGMKEITVIRTDKFLNTYESYTTRTHKEYAHEFLEEKGISIDDNEILDFSLDDKLEHGGTLEIKQAKPITIKVDNTVRRVLTSKNTVGDALIENGIEIGSHDWAEPGFETRIVDNIVINLRRISVSEETVTEAFSGPVEIRTDDSMFEDESIVNVHGTEGVKDVVYEVLSENGVEVYREPVRETIIKEATPSVVTVGTKVRPSIIRDGKKYTYTKMLTVKATAYDTSPEENGGYTTTCTGMPLGYGIVAVDPRVIPLGTMLYIESTDDGESWSYGYCIAADVGGAIKGNRVDLCYYTQTECRRFGRRTANVYVLN